MTLSPLFAAETFAYAATVVYAESSISLEPTVNEANATVRWRLGTSGSLTAVTGGTFDLNLAEGPNVIEVHVAAQDSRYTALYTVTITREPQVSIAVATSGAVTEGGDVVFTVRRSRAAASALVVNLTVTDAGNVLDPSEEGAKSVTIAADESSAQYTVTTTDNTAFAERSAVTVAIASGDGYTASDSAGSASKDIDDDDFPSAEAALSADVSTADEGDTVTATVRVRTDGDTAPHSGIHAGRLTLMASSSASSTPGSDYAFTESDLRFNRADFTRVDVDPGPGEDFRWVAVKTADIVIIDDNDTEADEQMVLLLVRPDSMLVSDALHPNVRLGTATATVTIEANDSDDASLDALTLTDGTDAIGHLSPSFSSNVTEYTAGVGNGTASVTVSATTGHEAARVRIATQPAEAGTSTRTLPLRVGDNSIPIVVTAENGDTSTYTLTVTRTEPITTLSPSASDPTASYPTTVTYEIGFRGRWNRQVTPPSVPGGAHFTDLIGGVHSAAVEFLAAGKLASDGVEVMAETGATSTLRDEVQTAIDAETAYRVVSQSVGSGAQPNETINAVEFTTEFPRLTLTSMVAPTPDWFVGVSGLSLLDTSGRWLRSHEVNLYPWDAGTEDDVSSGRGFRLNGANSVPAQNIRSLQGAGPFTIQRIASLDLRLISISTERELDEEASAGVNVGPPVSLPVVPSEGGGSIVYSLAGADAGSFEINSATGQLRTKTGVDYDFEVRTGAPYALTVLASEMGLTPAVTTNIGVTVSLNNVDEPGTLTVTPLTTGVDVLMTASVSDLDGGVANQVWLWERSDNGTSGWAAIASATAATYTPVDADEGKYLRVTATYDDAQGTGRTLTKALGQVAASTVLSSDNTLSSLSLSDLTLSPAFSSSVIAYSADVGYAFTQSTVAAVATAQADDAQIRIVDGNGQPIPDVDPQTKGDQVPLAIGANTIVVRVTAENGTSQDYTVTVTRAQPVVTLSAPSGDLAEGSPVPFEVTRSAAAADTLAVDVLISEDGTMVSAEDEMVHTVTIPSGQASVRLNIPTVGNDDWQPHSTVTAQVQTGTTYTLGTPVSATQTVSDDDFPSATASLSVASEVDEDDGTVAATVTVVTAGDMVPHEGTGPLRVSTVAGTAGTADFTALTASAGTLEFAAADFVAGDGDNGCEAGMYCASKSVDIAITDDTAAEPAETFTVELSLVAPVNLASPRTDSAIALDVGATSKTVTIGPSDRSDVKTLSSVSVAGTTLTPAGDGSYTAAVAFADEQVSVVAAVSDATAQLAFLDASDQPLDDASEQMPGFQVAVGVGETVVKVQVTAQDTSVETYPVTITRAEPVLTLTVTTSELTEGDDVVFTVSRDGSTSEQTAFSLTVTETGGPMATAGLSATPLALTIGAGQSSATHTVTTAADDVWEPHAEITAAATSEFDFANSLSSIAKQVSDDDFPAAEATLTVSPLTIAERPAAEVTATLTVTTTDDHQPHAGTGTITVATTPGTATAGDYTAISTAAGAVSFEPGDFAQVDIGGGTMRWQASREFKIGIVDDDDAEKDSEQFTVSMAPVTSGPNAVVASLTVATPTEFTVSIDPSDLSSDATLRSLGITEASLSPSFSPTTTTYAATVPFENRRITIDPQAVDADILSLDVLDGTAEIIDDTTPLLSDAGSAAGVQVDLDANTPLPVAIRVIAEDGSPRIYRVTITRELPQLTISLVTGEVTEGTDVVVRIARNAAADEPTGFVLNISEDGQAVDDAIEADRSTRFIQGDESEFTLTIPTVDDGVWDATSTVTVELVADAAAFTTSGSLTVTTTVSDNDFPAADAVLSVSNSTVDEGLAVTATVTITTERLESPNADAGTLRVSTQDGPDPDGTGNGAAAIGGRDYRPLTGAAGELDFDQGDFIEGDGSNGCPVATYCAAKDVTITTLQDTASEDTERFTVSLAPVTGGPSATDANVHFADGDISRAVDIAPNDQANRPGLRSIGLTGGDLSPAFVSTTATYTAAIGFDHAQVTLAPQTLNTGEEFAFTDENDNDFPDADPGRPGLQVDLQVGTPVAVNIVVTANDQQTTLTYTVTLTRQLPEATIGEPATSSVVEGGTLSFAVMLNGPVENANGLDVSLTVSETGDMLPVSGTFARTQTVNIPAGRSEATLEVPTVDDEAWEEHSAITVTIAASGSYTVSPLSPSATRNVSDNDFPASQAELTLALNPAIEGATMTAQVTITTARDEEPREDAGSIELATVDGTATAGTDFTGITQGTLNFARSDFKRIDIDTDPADTVTDFRWRAAKSLEIAIADDNEQEGDETFAVTATGVTTGSSPIDSAVTVAPVSVTAVIGANDVHRVSRVTVRRPGRTDAQVDIAVDNPSRTEVTVSLQYRTNGGEWTPVPALTAQTSGSSVQVPLSGLQEAQIYEVRASLDSGFATGTVSTTRFSTLGSAPAVSDIEVESDGPTGAAVTVFIANAGTVVRTGGSTDSSLITVTVATSRSDEPPEFFRVQSVEPPGSEQTVSLRYRHDGEAWSATQTETTSESSATFQLSGLHSGALPELEATLEDDFDEVGVQRVQFSTPPPEISQLEATSITAFSAVISVTVTDRTGDHVHLRYRTSGHWVPMSTPFLRDDTANTFTLTGLTPGTGYAVEASHDGTFGAAAQRSCVSFVTDASPDDDDGMQASTTCGSRPSSSTPSGSTPSGSTPSGSTPSGSGSSSSGGGGGADFDVGVATFVVANGWSPADVGVASVLAARTAGAVVVYTDGGALSAETATLLREALPAEVVIVGGTAAVTRDVRSQIRSASPDSGIDRITGADRAATAAGAARQVLGAPSGAGRVTVVVANGWSPPDIGAAAALAARSGRSAVIYVGQGSLPESSAAVLRDYEVARVVIVGGTAAISDDVHDQIAAEAGGGASMSRLTGADRIATAALAARRVLGSPAGAPGGITLVVANGWSPPDVGVAAALAAALDNAAVAYVSQESLPDATAALIRDYRPTQIVIVGGRTAVHDDVRTAIAAAAPDNADTRRVTGRTRTDTAARAARSILRSR